MAYLVLKNIQISNANAISGMTWGFPAVSHFLGFVHALSRHTERSEFGFSLDACAIVCNQHQVHAHRENAYEPYAFSLTRNPLTKEGKTAPIVEEGRMHLTVSLVIECNGVNRVTDDMERAQSDFVKRLAERNKLAGGTITDIGACYFSDEPHAKLLRRLLPGFILVDRSQYLAEQNEQCNESALQNWLDFSALKYQATDTPLSAEEHKESPKVEWQRVKSSFDGYLVPIQIGYKKIAPTYAAGDVANTRDNDTPVSFVEAIYSVGEWVGSPSRLTSMQQALWQHAYRDPFYVCHTQSQLSANVDPIDLDDDFLE
ncbi:type I-F CRISPR-associated protein Csy2 [Enterovibrio norvegicus FF-33]|nr:type I-F CRISPR-associated protein Csy2 [Enterovibrio norvegicus FF-33]